MKKMSRKIRLNRTLKIADIDIEKLSEGSGLCPENPQGTSPLTQFGLCPNPPSPEGRKRAQLPPFLLNRIIREPYVNRLSRHILTAGCAACSGIPRFY